MLILTILRKYHRKHLMFIKNDNNNTTNEDLGMNQIADILAFFGPNNGIPAQITRMRK
jgi:hypothetical protein